MAQGHCLARFALRPRCISKHNDLGLDFYDAQVLRPAAGRRPETKQYNHRNSKPAALDTKSRMLTNSGFATHSKVFDFAMGIGTDSTNEIYVANPRPEIVTWNLIQISKSQSG